MNHLDYKLLQALDVVLREQSFERAANQLHLTQSAVSQRIKQLELQVAQPVLIRSQPLQLTDMGQLLLTHYQQVQQLERELLPHLSPNMPAKPLPVTIATNADSLATWLIPALTPLLQPGLIELNLLIEDENRTIERLRHGEAFGAITTQAEALPGCQSELLGYMDYVLTASSGFIRQYFPDGLTEQALRKAPGVAFDQRDDMHISFIEQHFGLPPGSYPCHTVRSSEAFVALAKAGAAYCLIPKLQISRELESGELIELMPETPLRERGLYWQRWALERGMYRQISQRLLTWSNQSLPQQ
ncbi:LysR family transcriptional regulator ArgP [Tolumonas lignilytica]|uniref:LysR family transcriptional regulator ArgP n=1 Tax=Tolumonas lignilytica TaxID=1283284 RepID=UPI00046479DD|nr:LysR family transcriptional regulator ArgP [Tolumonas lignilytica]